jgi:hypothetical protein
LWQKYLDLQGQTRAALPELSPNSEAPSYENTTTTSTILTNTSGYLSRPTPAFNNSLYSCTSSDGGGREGERVEEEEEAVVEGEKEEWG